MSVLVRGMEMPKNCWSCPFFHKCLLHIGDDELLERYTCLRTGESTDKNVTGYMNNCPLIELPPHGDLIDRDELHQSIKDSIDECHKWAEEVEDGEMYARVSQALGTFVECALRVKNAPTVIPAEGKEE